MARRRQQDEPTPDPASWPHKDILVPYVLLAVSIQHSHGYAIQDYLRSLGLLGLEMSTLYRTLRHLETEGLLSSDWMPGPVGPARRVYMVTDLGYDYLDNWAKALSTYRGMIDRFFLLYRRPRKPQT